MSEEQHNLTKDPVETRRITPPPDFPVTWRRPEWADYHWTRDREHLPDPFTPMCHTAALAMIVEARQRVAVAYDEAIVQRYDVPINYYLYTCLVPFKGTPEELDARAQRNREKISLLSLRLADVWENEWKPELADHWAFWAAFDRRAATLDELRVHLEDSMVRGARLYELHHLMGSPMWFSIDEFEKIYADLFPGTTPLQAHRLLQGFGNKTMEIDRALWRLSRSAQANPSICQVLIEQPAARALAALEALPSARRFLDELQGFLRAYGGRSNMWDWGQPSWEDDPSPVFNNLKIFLAQADRNLEAEQAAAAAERDAAIAKARQALTGYPQPVRERFEQLLRSAQVGLV
ncbi:MAG: hypothetical protein LUQ69_10165, partial [Methanoregulaceae archaeon]|nr:hypothetical protein [Methanoregulaceae archaeon]